jgi:hypothetical protein
LPPIPPIGNGKFIDMVDRPPDENCFAEVDRSVGVGEEIACSFALSA